MAMIESNRRYIRRCAENVLTDFKEVTDQLRLLATLRDMTVAMVEAEQRLVYQQVAFSEAEEAVKRLREEWANGQQGPDVEHFSQVHTNTIKSVMEERKKDSKKEIEQNQDVKYIDQLIKQQEKVLKSPGDGRSSKSNITSSRSNKRQSDLELLSSQDLNIIDPVTKKTMTEPVRHTKCGHVYDKGSVMQMIKSHGKRGFKCPYMGCACRDPIKERHLEPALDYQREIEKRNSCTSRPANPSKFPS